MIFSIFEYDFSMVANFDVGVVRFQKWGLGHGIFRSLGIACLRQI